MFLAQGENDEMTVSIVIVVVHFQLQKATLRGGSTPLFILFAFILSGSVVGFEV